MLREQEEYKNTPHAAVNAIAAIKPSASEEILNGATGLLTDCDSKRAGNKRVKREKEPSSRRRKEKRTN